MRWKAVVCWDEVYIVCHRLFNLTPILVIQDFPPYPPESFLIIDGYTIYGFDSSDPYDEIVDAKELEDGLYVIRMVKGDAITGYHDYWALYDYYANVTYDLGIADIY